MTYTLITGASMGLGAVFAKALSAQKHNLILVARSKARLEELAQSIRSIDKVDVVIIVLDLSKPKSATKLFDATQHYTINRLINNAGFGMEGDFLKHTLKSETHMLQLNALTLMKLCHLYAPAMQKAGFGEILNVASTAAFQPGPYMAGYYASKAYVKALSLALHYEMKPWGIKVSTLCPGATKTEFFNPKRGLKLPSFAMSSHTVVQQALKGLAQNKKCIIPGFSNRLGTLLVNFTPLFIVLKLSAYINKNILGRAV